MSAIVLQFLDEGDILSEAIEYFTQGSVAHVDAVLPDGGLLGARAVEINGVPAGVQIRQPGYKAVEKIYRVCLDVPREMAVSFYALIEAEIGKPYDYTGVAGFVAGCDWRNPNAWYCSDLQAVMLERCKFFARPLVVPERHISPACLLAVLSGRSEATITIRDSW